MPTSRSLGLCLAGGGQRAFMQIGFLERWWEPMLPRLGAVSACSAGACFGIIWASGRQPEAHAYWLSRRAGITRNFDWGKALRGERPTPQMPIYPDTMRFALAEGGFERIKALPFPFLILTAILPSFLPAPLSIFLGMAGYSLERQLSRGKLHPRAGQRVGFQPFAMDARDCRDPDELVALVLASSATPPFTPLGAVRGHRLLDGGIIDNAPASLTDGVAGVERTVVLLTRPYPDGTVGRRANRLYLAPSEPAPISRWDYTSEARVEATLALGRHDAMRQAPDVAAFLEGR